MTNKELPKTIKLSTDDGDVFMTTEPEKFGLKTCFENDDYGHRHKLSSIADQKALFEFEGFVIKEFDGWNMWLENPQGEGLTIPKIRLKNLLNDIFNKLNK